MDREEFICDEYISMGEYQNFPAELYRGREILNTAPENFSSTETGNTAAPPSVPSGSRQQELSQNDIDNLTSQSASSGSSSVSSGATGTSGASAGSATGSAGAVAASAGATAGAVATGFVAVGAAVVLGIVPVIADETEPLDYGTFNYLYYVAEYYEDTSLGEQAVDLAFNFTGELKEGFTCNAVDVLTGEIIPVIGNEIVFTGLTPQDRAFNFNIVSGSETVETFTVNYVNSYVDSKEHDISFTYKVTYNADGTANVYTNYVTYYEADYQAEFDSVICLYGEDGSKLDYQTTVIDESNFCIFNVEAFTNAEFRTYLVEDGNRHSYFREEILADNREDFVWNASIVDDELTVQIDSVTEGEISVEVTHDDLTKETFTFNGLGSGDDLVGSFTATLSKLSFNPTVKITANAVLGKGDPEGFITDYEGVDYLTVTDEKAITSTITTKISLTKLEIYNASYNEDYAEGVTKVRLFLDGYTNQGDTLSVKVLNSDGEMVDTIEDLTSDMLATPITFEGLIEGADYTFVLYTVTGGIENQAGSYTKTLATPSEYSSFDLFISNPNPGDAMVTYNDDGTANVYLYVSPKPTEGYDRYYTVTLKLIGDDGTYTAYECTGTEAVAKFEDLPAGDYIINYAEFVNDNGTCYVTSDLGYPSGTINTSLTADGYYSEYCGFISLDETEKTLTIGISGKLTSDLNLSLTFNDAEPVNVTITPEQTDDSFYYNNIVDLSGYVEGSILNYKVTAVGEAKLGCTGTTIIYDENGNPIEVPTRNLITEATAIKGSESCLYIFEIFSVSS